MREIDTDSMFELTGLHPEDWNDPVKLAAAEKWLTLAALGELQPDARRLLPVALAAVKSARIQQGSPSSV